VDGSHRFAMYNDRAVVFTIDAALLEKLPAKVDDARDRALVVTPRTDLREITITKHGHDLPDLRFVRSEGVWELDMRKMDGTIGGEQVRKLIDALYKSRAEGFATVVEIASKPPRQELQLDAVGQREPERLFVFDHTDALDAIVRNDEKIAQLVPREQIAMLREPLIAYRDRTVLDLRDEQVGRVVVRRTGEYPATYEFTRSVEESADSTKPPKAGPWSLEGFERQAAEALLRGLTPLVAESWIGEGELGAANRATVEITRAGEDGPMTLVVDLATRRARLWDGPVFLVDRTLAALLSSELRERRILRRDIDQLATVRFDRVVVRRDRDGRFTVTGEHVLDEQQAAALFQALANLYAMHFVDPARATGDPDETLVITDTKGDEHTLSIYTPAGSPPIGVLGDRAFTLHAKLAEALTTRPFKAHGAAETPPPSRP